jgi:hypothetical protein
MTTDSSFLAALPGPKKGTGLSLRRADPIETALFCSPARRASFHSMTRYQAWQIASVITAYYISLLFSGLLLHRSIQPLWGSLIIGPVAIGLAVWVTSRILSRK